MSNVFYRNVITFVRRGVRGRAPEVFYKKAGLKNFGIFKGNICVGVSF